MSLRVYYVFDRWGNQIDSIVRPIECHHKENLEKAEDTLTIAYPGERLTEGDRLVWRDRSGKWHEHEVTDTATDHSDGQLYETATCDSSYIELSTDYLEEVEPGNVGASVALGRALSASTWIAGICDVPGTAQFSFFHQYASEAIGDIAEALGAEIETEIEVEGTGVKSRKVNLRKARGEDRGALLVYGRNIAGIHRTIGPDPIYTAAYGYGKSETTEAGGQRRKLTFGSINGGKNYVEDLAALERYGRPDGHGGKKHSFTDVEYSQCDDAAELKALTAEYLASVCKPAVSYDFDVIYLETDDPVGIGDVVHVRDRDLDERLSTRVLSIDSDECDASATKLVIGMIRPTLTQHVKSASDSAQKAQDGVADLNERSHDWDDTSEIVDTAPGEWLQKVIDRLNQEFDAAKTYKFSSFEKGDIWANGPLTADGRPTGNTSSAINLNGLGFRIASKVEGGDFKWEVFGTGEGFTASLINVGILRCGDNYLNLDTGEMRIALTAKVGTGSQSVSGYVQNVANTSATNAANQAKTDMRSEMNKALDDYLPTSLFDSHLNMRNVASALTNGFVDKGLFIESGHVVFNGDYVRTGVIEAQNGASFFDLDNGYLEAVGNIYSVGQHHEMHARLINGQLDLIMDQTAIGTLATYTRSNNAMVHITGLKAFTTLVLAGPGLGVSSDSTVNSGLTWTDCINGTINHVAGVSVNGSTATFDMWSATFFHGLLTGQSNTADVSFNAGTRSVNLIASVEPGSEVVAGEPMQVVQITTQDELAEAAAQGRMVWIEGDEPGMLAEPVYTGEAWTMEVPEAHKSDPIVVPLADFVEAQNDLLQAELEAVVNHIGDARLTRKIATAKIAAKSGNAKLIARAVGEVSNGGKAELA